MKFKEWTIPGPDPSLIRKANELLDWAMEEKQAGRLTQDALSGYFKLYQSQAGHRFSTDDLLVASFTAQWASRFESALELGCGIGTIGISLAWKYPGLRLQVIEGEPLRAKLARANVLWNALESRIEVLEGDFRTREFEWGAFDVVVSSPPYFPESAGIIASDREKRVARFEERGGIEEYLRIGARALRAGGEMTTIFPSVGETRVLNGAEQAGLHPELQQPVIFREGDPPLVDLWLFRKVEDLPDWHRSRGRVQLTPLLIRTRSGEVSEVYRRHKQALGFPPT